MTRQRALVFLSEVEKELSLLAKTFEVIEKRLKGSQKNDLTFSHLIFGSCLQTIRFIEVIPQGQFVNCPYKFPCDPTCRGNSRITP